MKKIKKSLSEVLANGDIPFAGVNPALSIEVIEWEETDDMELQKFVPSKKNEYKFRANLVRDVYAWMKYSKEALFLYGPTGSGKSSLIKELYGRLGIPLFRMTISEDTELSEIFGHYVLGENGQTVFQYGPATLAAKYGCPLLLDEIGRGNPSVMVGLNGLLEEGAPFALSGNNGEVVVPHPDFRVILTDNTNLSGDDSGNYQTAMIQDKSFVDRIGMSIEVGYPADEEEKLLEEHLEKLVPSSRNSLLEQWFDQEGIQVSSDQGIKKGQFVTRHDFIKGVMQVRDMIRQQSRDCGNQTASALERTMSVRTLQRWVTYCVAFCGASNQGRSSLHYAMEKALTNTCTPSTKIAIHAMVKSVFGVSEKLE